MVYIPALQLTTEYRYHKAHGTGRAILRFGDECRNGHNTFSLTAESKPVKTRYGTDIEWGGCCHEFIRVAFPELSHLIKWHLVSEGVGPLHYVANTLYWSNGASHPQGNVAHWDSEVSADTCLDHARKTAVAPEATLECLQSETWLRDRLPALLAEFMADMKKTFPELENRV